MKRSKLFIFNAIMIAVVSVAFLVTPVSAAKRRYVSIAAGWVTGAN